MLKTGLHGLLSQDLQGLKWCAGQAAGRVQEGILLAGRLSERTRG